MAHKKVNLPSKICVVCDRPFSWRKKWEKDWSDVKYCSKQCQKKRPSNKINEQSKNAQVKLNINE